MTTVTLPNATNAATFESDLDAVSNGATNTDYIIPITGNVTIANTDADVNSSSNTQLVGVPTGSTLTLNGPGSLTIMPPDYLLSGGTVIIDAPVTGELIPYSGSITIGTVSSGATPSGGVITGSIQSSTTSSAIQNSGQIAGASSSSLTIYLGGGVLTNTSTGTITNASAGAYTIDFGGTATLNNAGTVSATGTSAIGVAFGAAATLTNGTAGQPSQAMISATSDAAYFVAGGTVTNDGTISSSGLNALQFAAGGDVVTNGSSTDTAATIVATAVSNSAIDAVNGTVTNSAIIKGGLYGVLFSGDSSLTAASVVNTGIITATDASGAAGSGFVAAGVALVDGGTVTNGSSAGTVASTASISGADIGVDILGGNSSVTNSGTISGAVGINFTGNSGKNATGTVIDSGAITSTGGATGRAILFGSGAEKLTLQQGFAITGQVVGGSGTGDTTVIEVAAGTTGTFSGLSGGGGTVSNGDGSATNGFAFTNVQSLDIDGSANWAFSGTNSLATLRVDGGAQVSGLLTTTLDPAGNGGVLTVDAGSTLELVAATGAGDTIDLAAADSILKLDTANSYGTISGSTFTGDVIGQAVTGSSIDLANVVFSQAETHSFNTTTNLLTVSDGTNTANISFAPGLFSTLGNFVITTDGLGGTLISVACYCPGTRITTPGGDVDVETLAIGDLVTMIDGRAEPIRWIGRRTYAGRFLAANPKVNPVRFCKGSLGKGLPRRDLLVSPEHAMFINGKLVPARCLVNGQSIVVEAGLKLVDYIHIEFASHEVILAEGAASESFVDDDSRAMFQNAAEYKELYPNAPAIDSYYAERVDGGFEVELIRTTLAKIPERAENRRRARRLKAA